MKILLFYLGTFATGTLIGWLLPSIPATVQLAYYVALYVVGFVVFESSRWYVAGRLTRIAAVICVLGIGLICGYGIHRI